MLAEEMEALGQLPPGSAGASRRGLGAAVVALRYRDFALFWTGALISSVGTWMQNVTVPYVLFVLTHSAAWVGLAAFVQFIPGVLLGPVAGSFADRFQRRLLIMWTQLAAGLLALALWVAWVTHARSPGLLLLIIGLGGVAQGLTMPAWQAFVSELVPREHLLNAITVNSAQFNAARAIGPAIAGAVLGRFGASWAFLVNAVSYVAVIGALALMRTRLPARGRSGRSVRHEFAEGLTYARRHTGILVAIILVSLVAFLAMPVIVLAPVLAKRVYHVGAASYGVMTAAYGLGAVSGAVLIGVIGDRLRRSQVALGAIGIYVVGLAGIGAIRVFAVGLAFLALSGIAFLAAVASLNTAVQLIVAEEIRGRVLAIYAMALTAAYPFGALVQGWVADRLGAPATLLLAAAVLATALVPFVVRPAWVRTMDGHGHRAVAAPA